MKLWHGRMVLNSGAVSTTDALCEHCAMRSQESLSTLFLVAKAASHGNRGAVLGVVVVPPDIRRSDRVTGGVLESPNPCITYLVKRKESGTPVISWAFLRFDTPFHAHSWARRSISGSGELGEVGPHHPATRIFSISDWCDS